MKELGGIRFDHMTDEAACFGSKLAPTRRASDYRQHIVLLREAQRLPRTQQIIESIGRGIAVECVDEQKSSATHANHIHSPTMQMAKGDIVPLKGEAKHRKKPWEYVQTRECLLSPFHQHRISLKAQSQGVLRQADNPFTDALNFRILFRHYLTRSVGKEHLNYAIPVLKHRQRLLRLFQIDNNWQQRIDFIGHVGKLISPFRMMSGKTKSIRTHADGQCVLFGVDVVNHGRMITPSYQRCCYQSQHLRPSGQDNGPALPGRQ